MDRELLEAILQKVTDIKNNFDKLENRVKFIETNMVTKNDISQLEGKIDKLNELFENIKSVTKVSGDHEMCIGTLTRRPV
jgi:SpoVK/Ycf46/Vps4 family AAA+-type ATPase